MESNAIVVIGKALRHATGEYALQLKAKAVILVPALKATRGFRLSCREAGQFPELIALVGKVGAKGARKRGYLSRPVIGTFDNVFIAPLLHGQPHVVVAETDYSVFIPGFRQPSGGIVAVSLLFRLVVVMGNARDPSASVVLVLFELAAGKRFLDDTTRTVTDIFPHAAVEPLLLQYVSGAVHGKGIVLALLVDNFEQPLLTVMQETDDATGILPARELPHPLIAVLHLLMVVLIGKEIVDAVVGQYHPYIVGINGLFDQNDSPKNTAFIT